MRFGHDRLSQLNLSDLQRGVGHAYAAHGLIAESALQKYDPLTVVRANELA